MKYYKVIMNDKPIDVLNQEELCYLKYNSKHKQMFNALGIQDAQAIYSSDRKRIWHEISLLEIPVSGYEDVKLIEIDKYEYNRLKFELTCNVEDLLDSYTLLLIERGVL